MTRIAIVGTGPSGLYLGKYLNNLIKGSKIDYFEKSNRLFGLFRYGIAPDRLSLKTSGYSLVSNKYRFFTGVEVGTSLRVEKLLKFYKFVFLCCGAGNSKILPIKNEKFGVFDALDIVKYYNKVSEQDYLTKIPKDLKIYQVDSNNTENTLDEAVEKHLGHLSQLKEVEIGIIGNGNVALDILRAFCGFRGEEVGLNEEITTSREATANSDRVGNIDKTLPVNPAFLELVGRINIKRITLFGRSSLTESKFTNSELRELLHVPNIYTVSSGCLNRLESPSTANTTSRAVRRKIELFKALTGLSKGSDQSRTAEKTIHVDFKFNTRVVSVENDPLGNVAQVLFETTHPEIGNSSGSDSATTTATNKEHSSNHSALGGRACHLLVRSIGFEPTPAAQQLLGHVDNRRVFANGWLTSAGRGDLNRAVTSSLQLAKYVQHLTGSAPDSVDSNSNYQESGVNSTSCGSTARLSEGALETADILSYLQSKHTVRAN